MSKHALVLLTLISVLAFVMAPGCRPKAEVETVPEPAASQPATPRPEITQPPTDVRGDDWKEEQPVVGELPEPSIAELNRQGVLQTVYFGFDKYDLSDESRRILRSNADWLKNNSKYNVAIEGHCDERGSIEYNLALGERRASAVREYLASLGIAGSRMRIVSYGEERPVALGHNEASWSQNRRAAFVIER